MHYGMHCSGGEVGTAKEKDFGGVLLGLYYFLGFFFPR